MSFDIDTKGEKGNSCFVKKIGDTIEADTVTKQHYMRNSRGNLHVPNGLTSHVKKL